MPARDAEDKDIIVQHIVKLEDPMYDVFASPAGLLGLLCNTTIAIKAGLNTKHVQPEIELAHPAKVAPHHLPPFFITRLPYVKLSPALCR
jgi:hypothetical protein